MRPSSSLRNVPPHLTADQTRAECLHTSFRDPRSSSGTNDPYVRATDSNEHKVNKEYKLASRDIDDEALGFRSESVNSAHPPLSDHRTVSEPLSTDRARPAASVERFHRAKTVCQFQHGDEASEARACARRRSPAFSLAPCVPIPADPDSADLRKDISTAIKRNDHVAGHDPQDPRVPGEAGRCGLGFLVCPPGPLRSAQ